MTRRAAKVTMLPSQNLSAKLASAVLPALELRESRPTQKQRTAYARVVSITPKNDIFARRPT